VAYKIANPRQPKAFAVTGKKKYFMAVPPLPPAGFDAGRFAGPFWYQRWEVFKGISTPGWRPVDMICAKTQIPHDLAGKRVLDIGAWNGGFSFECERRGAAEVVAYGLEHPNATGFNWLKDLLGSKVTYVQGSVYTLNAQQLGEFDLILFFGVLYHLRYPLLALDRIRSVCRGDVLLETHTLTSRHLLRSPLWVFSLLVNLSALFRRTPIWRQYREFELHPEDQSNWFSPNIPAVVESLESAGFTAQYLTSWEFGRRSAFRGTAIPIPARLTEATYEGNSSLNAPVTGLKPRDADLFRRN
jgi:tRNA (mo5U34)-methyltransferase